jgi:uncharacterized protein (DUF2249 family)
MSSEALVGEAVIDTREIPPSDRPAIIAQHFAKLSQNRSLVLISDHDPLQLQRALAMRYGDDFSVEYLHRGPDLWRMRYRKARSENCCGGNCSGG